MKRDGLVWFLCGLLFCAGAVWGGVSIETDFFVVKDLHDLFDIISSIATSAALFVAVIGISSWRKQVKATGDHDLARRLSVCLSKYKNLTCRAWSSASSLSSKIAYHGESLDAHKVGLSVESMERDIESYYSAKAEMEGLAAECRAVWGGECFDKFNRIFKFESLCVQSLKCFLNWSVGGYDEFTKGAIYNTLRHFIELIDAENLESYSDVRSHVDLLTADIELFINRKFIS